MGNKLDDLSDDEKKELKFKVKSILKGDLIKQLTAKNVSVFLACHILSVAFILDDYPDYLEGIMELSIDIFDLIYEV